MVYNGYLSKNFDKSQQKKVIDIFGVYINKYPVTALAMCGHSGTLMGAVLCYEYNLTPILVRKEADSSHSCFTVEYNEAYVDKDSKYLIIDDLIDSGKTIARILSELRFKFICSGIFLYTDICCNITSLECKINPENKCLFHTDELAIPIISMFNYMEYR